MLFILFVFSMLYCGALTQRECREALRPKRPPQVYPGVTVAPNLREQSPDDSKRGVVGTYSLTHTKTSPVEATAFFRRLHCLHRSDG